MRRTRFVAPAVIAVLVALGGITAGLILAWDQAPPAVEADIVSVPEHENLALPGPTVSAPDTTPTPEPELEPPATPVTVEKGTETELAGVADLGPTADTGPLTGPLTEAAGPVHEGAVQGTVYTWQDGDETRRAILQPHPAVLETVAETIEGSAINKGATEDSAVEKAEEATGLSERPKLTADAQPVFRSESGGELMTLPGGIILVLDPEWDIDAVESFLSRNGIALDQTSELDFLDNGFFVETEAGFPSLELANALVEMEGVILSTPNWAREVEQK